MPPRGSTSPAPPVARIAQAAEPPARCALGGSEATGEGSVPVPAHIRWERERSGRVQGNDPAVAAGAADAPGIGEAAESIGDELVADAELLAQGGRGERLGGAGEEVEDAADGRILLLLALEGVEARRGHVTVVDDELEPQRGRSGRGAVLDLELEGAVGREAAEVEVRVAERVEVGAAAEADAGVAGGGLAGVVDEEDGGPGRTGELAQTVEDDAHLRGRVLVGAVEAAERIEEQEPGPRGGERGLETVEAVGEAHRVDDHVDGQVLERPAAGARQAAEARGDDGVRVLGAEEDDGTGREDAEASGARCAGGDGDAEVEGEEAFAALGRAAEDARSRLEEETIDDPGERRGGARELACRERGVGIGSHQVLSWSKTASSTSRTSTCFLPPAAAARSAEVARLLMRRSTPRVRSKTLSAAAGRKTVAVAPAARRRRSR